jgi:redox-sensitive bicupin YhaK (pirin superfamily)
MATCYHKKEAASLHYLPASDYHPADTYFHFSFANYYDPKNMNYGVLRVVNDDDVRSHSGFGRHPHRDIEIVSYIIDGNLTHWDSTTREKDVLTRGHAQAITAGTGVWHSEMNNHDASCRFLQIWIMPPEAGLEVRYGNQKFTKADRENRLLHIVGSVARDDAPLQLNQDVNMYISELTDSQSEVSLELRAGRQAYINCMEGRVHVEGIGTLVKRDSLEVTGPARLNFKTDGEHAHFIVIEMEKIV